VAGAKHYSELIAWQLADELRVEGFKQTSRAVYERDLKARGQTADALNSVCRNIAAGFGCHTHREFARFLEISRRSLNEVMDALRGARLKGYLTSDDLVSIHRLSRRLYPAISNLRTYLMQKPDGSRIDGQ
jgi:four helix bundle protein